jgi:hypothetical protein
MKRNRRKKRRKQETRDVEAGREREMRNEEK